MSKRNFRYLCQNVDELFQSRYVLKMTEVSTSGVGSKFLFLSAWCEEQTMMNQNMSLTKIEHFLIKDFTSEWSVTKIVGYGFCDYWLVGCGWLGISKSRLWLPQIVSYLVGYHLFLHKKAPFLPITARPRNSAALISAVFEITRFWLLYNNFWFTMIYFLQ